MKISRLLAIVLVVALVQPMAGTAARHATDVAEHPQGSLEAMLRMAPDVMEDLRVPHGAINYRNITAHLDPQADPAAPSIEEWSAAARAFDYGGTDIPGDFVDPEAWESFFGIDILAVSHLLSADPFESHGFTLIQGRFDPAAIPAALEASGYQPLDMDGLEVWQLDRDTVDVVTVSFEGGIFGVMQGNWAHVMLLDEETLVASPSSDTIEAFLAVARGEQPSLLEHPDVEALIAGTDPGLSAALIFPGEEFRQPTHWNHPGFDAGTREQERDLLDVIEAQHGPLPAYGLVLLGRAPAGESGVPRQIVIVADSQASAVAISDIVMARFDGQRDLLEGIPYADRFTLEAAPVRDGSRTVAFTFGLVDPSAEGHFDPLVMLLNARDLRFLNFGED